MDESKPEGKKDRTILIVIVSVIGGILVLALIIAIGSVILSSLGLKDKATKNEQAHKTLTIGDKPYLYPCSVATRDDFARIFQLENDNIGSMSETSALAAEYTKGGDLSKLAPSSSSKPRYATRCSYMLPKEGNTDISSIDIIITQFDSSAEAKKGFESLRTTASGDFTVDGIDNGTRTLETLPSFGADSFVKLPQLDQGLRAEESAYVLGSRVVQLSHGLYNEETVAGITPMLDAYSVAIKEKIEATTESQPVDLTGKQTVQNKKFVDLCRHTNLQKLADSFSVELRPDEMLGVSVYGSLPGSRAAADGVVSDCQFNFTTAADKQALEQKQKSSSSSSRVAPTSGQKWPHHLNISVNTYASTAEAKAAFDAKKAKLANPSSGPAPTIETITGLGDAAFMYHKETVQSKTFLDDTQYVLAGMNVVAVGTQRIFEGEISETQAAGFGADQFKAAYELLDSTLKQANK